MILERAKNLAYEAHEGQFRKYTKEPYIVHPEAVFNKLSKYKQHSVTMDCAAFLHDVLEDCPQISEERIAQETNEDVLSLVKELTNPSKGSTASRSERKKMDRDHLSIVSHEAKIIKMIDRICNLQDISLCSDENFKKLYAEESKLLLECLKDTDEELAKEMMDCINKVLE